MLDDGYRTGDLMPAPGQRTGLRPVGTKAMGNAVVAVPSERWPLAATDLYQVFDTSPGQVPSLRALPQISSTRDGAVLSLQRFCA